MHLLRLPNSVYYTRLATPVSLRESGYPNELKFSLLTRERKTAYRRNVEQVQLLHALFEKAIALFCSFTTNSDLGREDTYLYLFYLGVRVTCKAMDLPIVYIGKDISNCHCCPTADAHIALVGELENRYILT